jgi:RNA polymerase sigma-70 factor, ECF subfamily
MATPSLTIHGTIFPVTLSQGLHDLYERHAEAVFRTALRITGNSADAEDVLQNVFLRVLDHQHRPNPDWSPENYLRRAATNASIDLLRRRATRAETVMNEDTGSLSGENKVLMKERLRRAMATLDEEDAQLFVLCYLEGLSYQELAAQFSMERGTVASRLFRIRTALKQEMER